MKSDHTEGGLLSNLELTGNRLLLDQTLEIRYMNKRVYQMMIRFCLDFNHLFRL